MCHVLSRAWHNLHAGGITMKYFLIVIALSLVPIVCHAGKSYTVINNEGEMYRVYESRIEGSTTTHITVTDPELNQKNYTVIDNSPERVDEISRTHTESEQNAE